MVPLWDSRMGLSMVLGLQYQQILLPIFDSFSFCRDVTVDYYRSCLISKVESKFNMKILILGLFAANGWVNTETQNTLMDVLLPWGRYIAEAKEQFSVRNDMGIFVCSWTKNQLTNWCVLHKLQEKLISFHTDKRQST